MKQLCLQAFPLDNLYMRDQCRSYVRFICVLELALEGQEIVVSTRASLCNLFSAV